MAGPGFSGKQTPNKVLIKTNSKQKSKIFRADVAVAEF